jgi:hypothetical protein
VVVAVESIKLAYASAEEGWRNPITGIAGCCARGASDHAAALDANRKQLEAHKREHEQGSPRSRVMRPGLAGSSQSHQSRLKMSLQSL